MELRPLIFLPSTADDAHRRRRSEASSAVPRSASSAAAATSTAEQTARKDHQEYRGTAVSPTGRGDLRPSRTGRAWVVPVSQTVGDGVLSAQDEGRSRGDGRRPSAFLEARKRLAEVCRHAVRARPGEESAPRQRQQHGRSAISGGTSSGRVRGLPPPEEAGDARHDARRQPCRRK